jgi:chromate transport protein ChrA
MKYFLVISISIKSLILFGLFIGLSTRIVSHFDFNVQKFPEHEELIQKNTEILFRAFVMIVHLVLSIILDYHERKSQRFSFGWLILFFSSLFVFYFYFNPTTYILFLVLAFINICGVLIYLRFNKL